ncbi:helix-turn-helix transcriptional regulator [Priestia flexa]|jgi:transcriptional regulator with XRE-family HTH domain
MKELLGARIKHLRLKKGLTQDTFAKKIGYKHASIISEIESGKKSIGTDKLPIVALVLEVDINALFFEENILETRT